MTNYSKEIAVTIICVALWLVGYAALGQTPAAKVEPKLELSEVQSLRLQVKQRDARIAGIVMQQSQQNWQQSLNALNGEAEAIRKENKWPETTVFDSNNLTFAPAPPAAEKKDPSAKDPAAKDAAKPETPPAKESAAPVPTKKHPAPKKP